MMIVDAEDDLTAQLLAGLGAPSGGQRDVFARLVDLGALMTRRRQAQRGPAMRDQHPGLLDHIRAGLAVGGGECRNAVALLAAEELVYGDAERLALDVVKRDVDRRYRGGEHSASLEILATVHFLPERADAEGIAADKKLRIVLD